MPESIDEEIHPRLVETWKQFDKKVRALGMQYDTAADEPLRQAYSLPFKTDEDKTLWSGVADYMYETDNIKDGLVLLKIDPGYKKGEVLFSFMVAAILDDKSYIHLQERILGIFKTQPHITFNIKPTNAEPDLGRLPKNDQIHKMPIEVKDKFNEYIMQDENIIKLCRDLQGQCAPDIIDVIENILKHKEDIIADFKEFMGNQ